jgi:hypothetical protein
MSETRVSGTEFGRLGEKLEVLRSHLSDGQRVLLSDVLVALAESIRPGGSGAESGPPTSLGTFRSEPPRSESSAEPRAEADGGDSPEKVGRPPFDPGREPLIPSPRDT